MRKVLIIVGGSKGISKSLSKVFNINQFDTYHLSRVKPDFYHTKHLQMDIEMQDNVNDVLNKLCQEIFLQSYQIASFHFMTGGSLGLYSGNITNSTKKYSDIAYHNLIFPLWFTEQISHRLENRNNIKLHFNYYFSSSQGSLDGHPIYIACKSGLQSAFKKLVCQRKENISYSGYVLGMVDIEHKYLHKLSKNNPLAFDEILNSKIPSLNFANPDDISNFIFKCSQHNTLANGMLVDISGGGSWIQAKQ